MTKAQSLILFLQRFPHIRYALPGSEDYSVLRKAYIINDDEAVPLAIVRPQTAEDVGILVSYAAAEAIELTVRSGGHDLFGRCFAQDALAIDMREIEFVNVSQSQTMATIGGGTLAHEVACELGRHNLATAMGTVPTVGWIGWAIHGGYGPLLPNYGLGLDQILSARLVNAEGNIVEANEDMLAAIRGGGGCIGIIVDATIKVYPLDQVFCGVIVFDSKDILRTFKKFRAGLERLSAKGLPDPLSIQQSFVNTPTGRSFTVNFFWSSSDLSLGRQWLTSIKALGTVVHESVYAITMEKFLDISQTFIPASAYGSDCTISVREITDDLIEFIAESVNQMPTDSATLFSMHELRGRALFAPYRSVFGARTPHFVFEFIATSTAAKDTQKAWQWATGFRDTIRKSQSDNILSYTYISLTPPDEAKFSAIYGQNWRELRRIKEKYDPRNVFRHALPKFQ